MTDEDDRRFGQPHYGHRDLDDMIILRECISDGSGSRPKGEILTWREDVPLPPGMVWLRALAKSSVVVGPHGQVVSMSGDFTDEAKRIMEEMTREPEARLRALGKP